MCNSIAVSKAEGCCSCRVDVATNAGELLQCCQEIVWKAKKKKGQKKVTCIFE